MNIKTKLTKEILEYEYKKHGSMQKIADNLNVSIKTVYKYMKMHNILYAKHYKGIYSCDEKTFENDSEKSFYLAGFLAADGSLQKRKYSKIIKICLSVKDINHLKKIKILLNSNNPIKKYVVKNNKLIKNNFECAEIQIVSSKLFDDLFRFNIVPNKTKNYKMPEWLITHPLISHFIRGYFDGDGCISFNKNNKQGCFSILGTKIFIQQFKEILINNCKINDVKILNHKNVFKLSYSGNNNIKKIYEYLYLNANYFLDRKHENMSKCI